MENTLKVIKLLKYRICCQLLKNNKNCRNFSKVSNYSEKSKDIIKDKKDAKLPSVVRVPYYLKEVQVWNEAAAIRKTKRDNRPFKNINSVTDYLKTLQGFNNFPRTFTELFYLIRRRHIRNEILAQKYLPERQAILKPDLAAAHFIIRRRGSVKFLGKEHWTGIKEKLKILPSVYVPGYFIEAINCEGTGLYYEGLKNLCDLNYLSWLSLKGLENMDDWCMDWLSATYGSVLTYLDISNCKKITYRGLSCFYRFRKLKTLNVGGISDSPEFKVACIMLQELFPDLEIIGIDLNIPKEITPLGEIKKISEKQYGLKKI